MGHMNRDPQAVPGVEADRPSEIPPPGWFQIVKRAWKESKKDSVPLLSAGVAFYAFLALVPGADRRRHDLRVGQRRR
jgi:membrane protein